MVHQFQFLLHFIFHFQNLINNSGQDQFNYGQYVNRPSQAIQGEQEQRPYLRDVQGVTRRCFEQWDHCVSCDER